MADLAGRLIITWPRAGTPSSSLVPFMVELSDADTGERITTAVRLDLVADCSKAEPITVELTTLADSDGNRLAEGAQVVCDDEGHPRITTSRWLVAEMRVRS